MDASKIKVVAFDMDGTLTQHKTPLDDTNRKVLQRLAEKYKLLIVGAGTCRRIFDQLGGFPLDIIGNYGMQYAKYNSATHDIDIVFDYHLPVDTESIEKRVTEMRAKYGYTDFAGRNVEYHPSGCVTFPILGTDAKIEDKLAFDPDRAKRRRIYEDVKNVFSDYTVFVGGSSSFDMAPAPYDKAYALAQYCKENGYDHSEVVFVGDDYGMGGNDEAVFKADFNAVKTDDYRALADVVSFLL